MEEAASVDWSFARRPKWVLSHIAVLALVLTMIAAGIWQIARHSDRADRNATIEARSELAPVDIGTIAGPGAPFEVGESQEFRRVTATGTYQHDDEVLIRNRSHSGAPGWWVITPLLTDAGWAVAVNRGWIPRSFDAESERPGTEAPDGVVEVQGYVQPSRRAEGLQVADPADGVLASLARPDIERLAQQVDYAMPPVVVQLAPDDFADEPAGGLPATLALPPLDGGPHASYAAQWFIFTTIALIGYPLILRRVARGEADSLPADD